jgi:hypothetical protein
MTPHKLILYGRRTLVESKEIAQVCKNFFRWFQNAGGAEKIMQRRAVIAPFSASRCQMHMF